MSIIFKIVRAALVFLSLITVSITAAQDKTGLLTDSALAFDGYLLYAPLVGDTAYLIDGDAQVIHAWQLNAPTSGEPLLLENGNLLYSSVVTTDLIEQHYLAGGVGGRIEELTWDGEVVWSYEYASDDYIHHHDFRQLPNGNIILIAWEYIDSDEAIAAGMNPDLLPENGVVWPDRLVEIDPRTDEVVWLWRAWDHLIQDYDPDLPNYGVVAENPQRINVNFVGQRFESDWHHSNSLAYNAERDEILLSVRNWNEIWIIDHSTTTAEAASSAGGRSGRGGDLLYRWGNPAAYHIGTEADRQLFLAHDPQWIADGLNGAGNILIFNNGDPDNGREFSSVIEIAPPLNADGTYDMTAAVMPLWEYRAQPVEAFYSQYVSSAERLPSGNTLIGSGVEGRIFEVTTSGSIIWDYINPYIGGMEGRDPFSGISFFRVGYYPPDYAGLAGRDLTPQS
jgi:hypothetical protein